MSEVPLWSRSLTSSHLLKLQKNKKLCAQNESTCNDLCYTRFHPISGQGVEFDPREALEAGP